MAEEDWVEILADEESLPQHFMKPPSLLDNRNNAGQNPTNEPTSTSEPPALFTIGTVDQERGENG